MPVTALTTVAVHQNAADDSAGTVFPGRPQRQHHHRCGKEGDGYYAESVHRFLNTRPLIFLHPHIGFFEHLLHGAADLLLLVLAGVSIDGGQGHHRLNADVGIGKNAMHSLRQFIKNDLFSAGTNPSKFLLS